MSNLRQAAEQALEALENHTAIKHPQQRHYRDSAIDALRIALAEEALQRLTDVQQEIEAALAEPNKCTHGVTDGNCKECYMAEEPVFDCPRCGHCCLQRKPLSDEEIEQSYRYIYRNVPDNFDHTIIGWIEQGIRYAEQAHGIGEKHDKR